MNPRPRSRATAFSSPAVLDVTVSRTPPGITSVYRAQPKMGHEAMVVGVAGFAVRDVLGLGHLLVQPIVREPDIPSDLGTRHRSEERSLGRADGQS